MEISLIDNEVNSYGLLFKLTNAFSKLKLTYGADIYYEFINSIERWTDYETVTEVNSEDIRGEFMNDSSYKTYSAFIQGEF